MQTKPFKREMTGEFFTQGHEGLLDVDSIARGGNENLHLELWDSIIFH